MHMYSRLLTSFFNTFFDYHFYECSTRNKGVPPSIQKKNLSIHKPGIKTEKKRKNKEKTQCVYLAAYDNYIFN
jgi:hypothetical protein